MERTVPPGSDIVLPALARYITAPPPLGRNDPAFTTSPYLFVTQGGKPVSVALANDVIRKIGRYASAQIDGDPQLDEHTREQLRCSLQRLTWHRLRHTWAEQAALYLYGKYEEAAWPILKWWGGWAQAESMEHYIRYARTHINDEFARAFQALFSFEGSME